MAQINVRVADEDKDIAEKVAKDADYSLTEYLGSIISYMAEHRTLPVVIKFKPAALTPDETFQQAITKFRDAYLRINDLCGKVLKPGEMTPLEALRGPIDDVQSAQMFYESYIRLIAMAPGQLEKVAISENEYYMFARCREHFTYIPGFLRTAVRMVNMNNRPVSTEDLEEMKAALKEAASHINILQGMVDCEVTAQSRMEFFLRDAEEALGCAQKATHPQEADIVCFAWNDRMNSSIRQAEMQFERLGVIPHLAQITEIYNKLKLLKDAVRYYLTHTSERIKGFDLSLLEELDEALKDILRKIRSTEKFEPK